MATPYSLYVCPEGQNVTLTCRILGLVSKGQDVTFYKTWYLSSRSEVQVCKERRPIRNFTSQHAHPHHGSHQAPNTSHDQAQAHGLELASDHHGNFSITVRNVTLQDSGLYCCHVVEIRHHHAEHRLYGYMELQVQTGEHPVQTAVAGVGGGGGLHICHVTVYETMSDMALKGLWLCKEWACVWGADM